MSTPFTQLSLDLGAQSLSRNSAIVAEALNTLSAQSGTEARGAVFTRPEVVDFILDLVGYTPDRPLHNCRLLEPAFGGGDFLLAAIDRLLAAWSSAELTVRAHVENLRYAVFAVELHAETYNATRSAVISRLHAAGIQLKDSEDLADHWLAKDDFLLTQIDTEFDFVVGNPPYVRQELIPPPLLAEYRKRYRTFHDRADLYIPFIERSLLSLANGGTVGFICADRWMKNRYGETLRQMIDREFHLKIYVDMVDTQAFQSEVAAYPAIFVIERDTPGATRIAHRPAIEHGQLHALARELRSTTHPSSSSGVRQVPRVTNSTAPWLLDTPDQVALIRTVESRFPLLEDAGCKVGIGVATGADDVFIGDFRVLDVEEERKLPLVTTKDIAAGVVNWQGQGIVNPYLADGRLAKLEDYPRLRHYLETRREVIANRHCAKKTPDRWYRTIDRIYPELAVQPKLLIPDIKGTAHVVFEEGKYYPHHNLYYITSNAWDLHALQAVLLSSLTETFMLAYSTKMRGGYLRFQAQYLRRLRLPFWNDVPHELKLMLIEAAQVRSVEACNEATYRLYGLPASTQREILNTP